MVLHPIPRLHTLLLAAAGIAGTLNAQEAPSASPTSAPPQKAPAQTSTPANHNDSAELAKQLQNPVAKLISVPFQYNLDKGYGPSGGERNTVNIQPIIPFELTKDWNLITRTILPVIYQNEMPGYPDSKFGLGDTTQTFFLSPEDIPSGSPIWGVGPAFLWPTATDDSLGTGRWGAGPSAVLLWQHEGWTVGGIANHIWSYAGPTSRGRVCESFINPFLSYTFPTATSIVTQFEATYDWVHSDWTIPVYAGVTQVFKIGDQPMSFSLQGKYYAEKPENGPDWGLRIVLTFVFK